MTDRNWAWLAFLVTIVSSAFVLSLHASGAFWLLALAFIVLVALLNGD